MNTEYVIFCDSYEPLNKIVSFFFHSTDVPFNTNPCTRIQQKMPHRSDFHARTKAAEIAFQFEQLEMLLPEAPRLPSVSCIVCQKCHSKLHLTKDAERTIIIHSHLDQFACRSNETTTFSSCFAHWRRKDLSYEENLMNENSNIHWNEADNLHALIAREAIYITQLLLLSTHFF